MEVNHGFIIFVETKFFYSIDYHLHNHCLTKNIMVKLLLVLQNHGNLWLQLFNYYNHVFFFSFFFGGGGGGIFVRVNSQKYSKLTLAK